MQGKVEICGVNTARLKVLSTEEMDTLLLEAKDGSEYARQQLIEGNLRLVLSVIQRFEKRGESPDDLFQVGCIGLMKAIDKFDTSYDVKFSTYAVPLIAGEIKRFLRDDGPVKVSRTLKENSWKIKKAITCLQNQLGREPTMQEIASETQLSVEEILMATDSDRTVESIYAVVYQSDGSDMYLLDKMALKQPMVGEEVVDRLLLKQLLKELTAEERQLIYLRFFQNKKQVEVARIMGITQVQVSRLEKKILLSMRKRAGTEVC